jgi:hypothetical protein
VFVSDYLAFDPAFADYVYKQRLSNRAVEEAQVHIFAPNFRGLTTNALRSILGYVNHLLKTQHRNTAWFASVKRMWRAGNRPAKSALIDVSAGVAGETADRTSSPSIFRSNRRLAPANPNGDRLVYSVNNVILPLNVVAFHSWRMVDIIKRVWEPKIRHPIDGSKRPRFGGGRQSQAQADNRGGGTDPCEGHLLRP